MRSRRRFSSYEAERINRVFEKSIGNFDNDEYAAIEFYLFELSRSLSKCSNSECDCLYPMIEQLAVNQNLLQRLKDVFSVYIENLKKKDKLHLLPVNKENNSESDFGTRRRRDDYIYSEDDAIFRTYNYETMNSSDMDFLRIMQLYGASVFAQLIYNTFFTTAKINPDKIFEKAPVRIVKKAESLEKVKFLQKELDLTDNEARYLLVRYRKVVVENLDIIMNSFTNNSMELYTLLLGISKSEFQKVIRPDGKLKQFSFINAERNLNPALLDCIEAQDLSLYFADCIKPMDLSSVYDLKTFCVPEENSSIYKSMIKSENPISILLYGAPGSGKTEYAKSLVKNSGKKALVFKNEADMMDREDLIGQLTCLLSLNRKDTVLIIDESESILVTLAFTPFGTPVTSKSKGAVNKMLELSQNKVIWIVNHTSQMDESTLRRFTVSYKFEPMTPCMLESIAEKKLNVVDVTSETKHGILKMLSNYNVTGASVDNMIKAITSMNTKDEKDLLQNVEIVLKDNSTLLYGKSKMREKVSSSYDISVLNTSIPAEKILKMLDNAKNYADKNPGSGAVRMLFYGLSGTGKTEFARYISQKLGKKILLKRASDIFDKYVGGTEHNIANAFAEAANNDLILLFDEADSFFSDRNNAVRNYERTQVNEFLTQLEEFPGIVICTTNLKNIMDVAMLRRFHITVDFKALTEDGISTLLRKYFSDCKFTEEQVSELLKYNSVTPGDFGRLAGTIRFMEPEEITAEYIISELCHIQNEKGDCSVNKRIGFCA